MHNTTDNNCRNCGATTSGNYCHMCGQETRLHAPSLVNWLRDSRSYVALEGRLWGTIAQAAVPPRLADHGIHSGPPQALCRAIALVSLAQHHLLRCAELTDVGIVNVDPQVGKPAVHQEAASEKEQEPGDADHVQQMLERNAWASTI